MKKVSALPVAFAIAIGGAMAPITPAAAHGPVRYVDIYYAYVDEGMEVGRDVYYCDDHFEHIGGISGVDHAYYYDC